MRVGSLKVRGDSFKFRAEASKRNAILSVEKKARQDVGDNQLSKKTQNRKDRQEKRFRRDNHNSRNKNKSDALYEIQKNQKIERQKKIIDRTIMRDRGDRKRRETKREHNIQNI